MAMGETWPWQKSDSRRTHANSCPCSNNHESIMKALESLCFFCAVPTKCSPPYWRCFRISPKPDPLLTRNVLLRFGFLAAWATATKALMQKVRSTHPGWWATTSIVRFSGWIYWSVYDQLITHRIHVYGIYANIGGMYTDGKCYHI